MFGNISNAPQDASSLQPIIDKSELASNKNEKKPEDVKLSHTILKTENTSAKTSANLHASPNFQDKTQERTLAIAGHSLKVDNPHAKKSELHGEWEAAKKSDKEYPHVPEKITDSTSFKKFMMIKTKSEMLQGKRDITQAEVGSSKYKMMMQNNLRLTEEYEEATKSFIEENNEDSFDEPFISKTKLEHNISNWEKEWASGKSSDGKPITDSKELFVLKKSQEYLHESYGKISHLPANNPSVELYVKEKAVYGSMQQNYKEKVEKNIPQEFLPETDFPIENKTFRDNFRFSIDSLARPIINGLAKLNPDRYATDQFSTNDARYYLADRNHDPYINHAKDLVVRYESNPKNPLLSPLQKPVIEFVAFMIAIKYGNDSHNIRNKTFLEDVYKLFPFLKRSGLDVSELIKMEKIFLEGIDHNIAPKGDIIPPQEENS